MIMEQGGAGALVRGRKPVGVRRLAKVAVLAVVAVAVWVGGGSIAAADSRCHSYCSGPHKKYDECMERCIEKEQDSYRARRESGRSVRDLCSSKGHEEESCLRDHGYFEDRRRW